VGVHLGPGVGAPPEALDVEAEHPRQPPDPELLGGPLLALAVAADPVLRFRQLLDVDELLEAIWERSFNYELFMPK
jgi:hypothetical protein